MASVASAVNTNLRDLDPVVKDTGYVGLKRGRRRIVPTSTTPDSLALAVAADASSTGTLSNVSGSASSVTVLAANVDRLQGVIFNDSGATLYLKFGSTASTSSFTYRLDPYYTLEVPASYTGIITGIWSSATGSARVTEVA